MKYAISACLLGENVRYDGGNSLSNPIKEFLKDKEYIQVCPEVMGGLTTPRVACELVGRKAKSKDGRDFSKEFMGGANEALEKIKDAKVDLVITKSKSPSCGNGKIYDGTFQKNLIDGDGLFVELLKKENISCISDIEFLEMIKKQ